MSTVSGASAARSARRAVRGAWCAACVVREAETARRAQRGARGSHPQACAARTARAGRTARGAEGRRRRAARHSSRFGRVRLVACGAWRAACGAWRARMRRPNPPNNAALLFLTCSHADPMGARATRARCRPPARTTKCWLSVRGARRRPGAYWRGLGEQQACAEAARAQALRAPSRCRCCSPAGALAAMRAAAAPRRGGAAAKHDFHRIARYQRRSSWRPDSYHKAPLITRSSPLA